MAGKGGKKERREERLRDITQDASGNMVYTGVLWRIADSGGPAVRRPTDQKAGTGAFDRNQQDRDWTCRAWGNGYCTSASRPDISDAYCRTSCGGQHLLPRKQARNHGAINWLSKLI